MEKLNELIETLGKAELARRLKLSTPMVITGWIKRGQVPKWRMTDLNSVYRKEFGRKTAISPPVAD